MSAAIEAAMLEAHRAGLSVIPMRTNKRPAISSWAEYTETQADELTVRRWARTAQGFAIICGGPTRLQVLDFEGPFLAERLDELAMALSAVGMDVTFQTWMNGYAVETPGQGMHIAVHVGGNETPPGNVKLAMDDEGHTLVETRGHGGYVVAAPSNGDTHPSGKPWVQARGSFDEICWATEEEWNAVQSALSTFDVTATTSETPPAAPALSQPGGVSLARIEHTSSWIDEVKMPPMQMVLDNNGWVFHHNDGEHSYWTRPGKDPHEGHSATVNANDRLFVFSSNAHPVPMSPGKTTYDAVDVLGCYQLGHLPSQSERTDILRTFAGRPAQHPSSSAPTGSGWLPDDFWEARPWLSQIRSAAWEAGRCPESILGAVLSTYSVTVPSTIRVEALAGGNDSPLNTFIALVGQPGAGKTGAITTARKLCGVTDSEAYRFSLPLRSGEGLVTAARIPQPKRKDEVTLTPLYRSGIQVVFDEGSVLASQNDRSGSTVVALLSTVWSGAEGAVVGGAKADGEESFPADFVRVSLIMGIQFGVGNTLFTGAVAAQGFPARLAYFAMDRPGNLDLRKRGSPDRLILPQYHPDPRNRLVLTFPAEVWAQVNAWDDARQRAGVDPLDGHKMLIRMRMAGLLALMDDEVQVDPIHWELAGEIERHSIFTRNRVISAIAEIATRNALAAGRIDAVRDQGRHDVWLENRATRLATWINGRDGSAVTWRQVKDRFNASDRKQLDVIVEYAIARHWVAYTEIEGKKGLKPGPASPH